MAVQFLPLNHNALVIRNPVVQMLGGGSMVQGGYLVEDIFALKAIASSSLLTTRLRFVKSLNSWYRWNPTLTNAGNDDSVVVPADSPAAGRWVKSGAA